MIPFKMNHIQRSLIIILLISIFSPLKSTKTGCHHDEFCSDTFGPSYHCDTHGKCNRKPLFPPDSAMIVFGAALLISFNILSFSLGVTANGIAFPAMIMLFAFTGKDSLAILKTSNIFSAPVNLMFICSMRNPKKGNQLYVDFELMVFLVPLVLVGSLFGVLAFGFFPGFFSYFFIFFVMIYLTYRNYNRFKAKEAKQKLLKFQNRKSSKEIGDCEFGNQNSCIKDSQKTENLNQADPQVSSPGLSKLSLSVEKEEQNMHIALVEENLDSRKMSERKDSCADKETNFTIEDESLKVKTEESAKTKIPNIFVLLWKRYKIFLLVLLAYGLMVMANLGRGTPSNPSVFGFTRCSPITFIFFGFCIFLIIMIAIIGFQLLKIKNRETQNKIKEEQDSINQKPEETQTDIQIEENLSVLSTDSTQNFNYTSSIMFKIGISAVIGGFISSAGVCGSLFITSSLMLLNIEPLVVKSTIGFAIFVMTFNNAFQFFFLGYFDLKNTLTIACITLVGCLVGNFIIKRLLNQNSSKANRIISICNICMTSVICFCLPVSSYFEVSNNSSFFSFRAVC